MLSLSFFLCAVRTWTTVGTTVKLGTSMLFCLSVALQNLLWVKGGLKWGRGRWGFGGGRSRQIDIVFRTDSFHMLFKNTKAIRFQYDLDLGSEAFSILSSYVRITKVIRVNRMKIVLETYPIIRILIFGILAVVRHRRSQASWI